jgi:hypothetical protein
MAKPLSDELAIEASNVYQLYGPKGNEKLGISESAFRSRCRAAEARGFLNREEVRKTKSSDKGIEIDDYSDEEDDLTLDELLTAKKEISKRKRRAAERSKLVNVKVNIQGPIGLTIFGDPHVDDDACDVERLEEDLNAVSKNEAMFAGHLGDITNNWIGRLMAKYADQVATRRHAKMLIDWVLKDRPNLFVVSGNHDLWNDGQNLLDWALEDQVVISKPHGVRLNLKFPSGDPIRIHARHDFPGNSIYNDTHSLRRELAFGLRDHILLAGHRHTDGYSMLSLADDPWISHLFRVSGYKMVDDYAEQNRFIEKRFAPSVTLIIDPSASPVEKVKPFWDTAIAVDYLKFLRKKRKV